MKDYTTCPEIWDLFLAKWPTCYERDLSELYALVERQGLHPGESDPEAPGSNALRWKRNVRNVLTARTKKGYLVCAGRGRYGMV